MLSRPATGSTPREDEGVRTDAVHDRNDRSRDGNSINSRFHKRKPPLRSSPSREKTENDDDLCVWRIYILTEKRINRGRGSSTPHQREPIERTMDDRRRVEKRTEVRNARCTVSAERIPFPPRGSRDAIPCLKRRGASERTRTSCRRRTRRSDVEAPSVGRRGKHGESTSVVDGNRMPEGRGW